MISKNILHYKILEKLGEGGMGIVYKAEDTKLNRDVAIKILPPHMLVSADDRARFHREAKAAAVLNHPNIATVYEINETEEKPFIVMEYVEGATLDRTIAKGPMMLENVISISIQIADGLGAAHEKGVVHRDIKASNILLGKGIKAKILDFGLAKTSMSTKLTQMGTTIGTVAYMSPEQVQGKEVDHRTDLWSLGVLIYEMIAGQLPFKAEYDQAIFYSIQNENPDPLTAIRTGVPMALEWIVNKLMAKDPAERYQSANDLIIDLKAVDLQASGFSRVSKVSSKSVASQKIAKRDKGAAKWIFGMAGALLGALFIYLLLPPESGVNLSKYKYTPFETEGVVWSGRWSADGKSVAYVKLSKGLRELRVRALDNPRSTLLGTFEGFTNLKWAPDGNGLYFIWKDTLRSLGMAGGNPKSVLDYHIWAAALSPDNQTLAIWTNTSKIDTSFGDSSSVFISDPDGNIPRRYLPDPFKIYDKYNPVYMKFSPDGSKLALTMFTTEKVVFWILPWPDGPGAKPYKLFEDITFGFRPPWFDWLPDSRRIVLNYQDNLWIGDTENGAMTQMTASIQGEHLSDVSPDGKRILLHTSKLNYDIVLLPLDGSAPLPLKDAPVNEYSATLSRNGQRMTYITEKSGKNEIWLEEQNGFVNPIVTQSDFAPGGSGLFRIAAISPDGKRVAYNRSGSFSIYELWVSNIEGGKPVLMFKDSVIVNSPCWSPDGQRLFAQIGFFTEDDSSYAVIRPLGSGKTMRLPDSMQTLGLPAWSPDGRWLALKQEGRLMLITPDGKQSRIIIPPIKPAQWGYCMVWSADSKKIYVASSVEGPSCLDEIDVESGTSRKIAEYGYDVWFGYGFSQTSTASLAADGKGILVTAEYANSNLYILDGALDEE